MAKSKKYICHRCGVEVTLKDIVNISAAKEYGREYFNVCTECYENFKKRKRRRKG